MMVASNLTVRVADISNKTTLSDLITFFSYCGTIKDISLESNGDQARTAFVTFKQPYAVQTALLLNNAMIADREVRISPLGDSVGGQQLQTIKEGRNAASHVLPASSKGHDSQDSTKDRYGRFKISETGAINMRPVINISEQAAGQLETAILNNPSFSKGVLWVSDVLDNISKCMHQASKYAADLGSYRKKNTDSRKQK